MGGWSWRLVIGSEVLDDSASCIRVVEDKNVILVAAWRHANDDVAVMAAIDLVDDLATRLHIKK